MKMDIMKGSLEDISRPATASRSRPGSRLFQVDKQKVNSSLCLEVLTPEPGASQWDLTQTSDDEPEFSPAPSPEDPGDQKTSRSSTRTSVRDRMSGQLQDPVPSFVNEECKDELLDNSAAKKGGDGCAEGPPQQSPRTEDNVDPKLEKAIKKMKALDEILLKKMAKEREVKAHGLEIRKQLWEELQLVSQQSTARSHEENVNTNKFLALTPQLDDPEDIIIFEKMFSPLFSTQPPPEDCNEDLEDSQGILASVILANDSGIETSDLLSCSERSDHRKRKNRDHKKVNFVQRNIELAKDAGSHVLLMDDEKLRLEQLLGDMQDGCSDDYDMANVSLWLVPSEGYTPEPQDLDKLAEIEAELQMYHSGKDPVVTSDHEPETVVRESKQEVSLLNFGNLETSPGEKVLRYTKELREQKTRLKEIDQQLEDIQRSSSSSALRSGTGCSSLPSESSEHMSEY
ncbi:fibrous sheath-interacting protein 1 isoform X2 [Phyllobates terribilis]|uniref:fibrous sheath-interacting protein 1 isoform X2 n=1 Tax=Phyllobates terribilis TaxID=111132 RepID=UPI003CCB38D6